MLKAYLKSEAGRFPERPLRYILVEEEKARAVARIVERGRRKASLPDGSLRVGEIEFFQKRWLRIRIEQPEFQADLEFHVGRSIRPDGKIIWLVRRKRGQETRRVAVAGTDRGQGGVGLGVAGCLRLFICDHLWLARARCRDSERWAGKVHRLVHEVTDQTLRKPAGVTYANESAGIDADVPWLRFGECQHDIRCRQDPARAQNQPLRQDDGVGLGGFVCNQQRYIHQASGCDRAAVRDQQKFRAGRRGKKKQDKQQNAARANHGLLFNSLFRTLGAGVPAMGSRMVMQTLRVRTPRMR